MNYKKAASANVVFDFSGKEQICRFFSVVKIYTH